MRFNIITTARLERTLNYFTSLMYHSLRSLGHQVVVTTGEHWPGATDILYAVHLYQGLRDPEGFKRGQEKLRRNENGYIIYFQEIFHDYGLNRSVLTDGERVLFHQVIADARMIISPFIESIGELRKLNENTIYCPLSYHPKLEFIDHDEQPIIDVLFFGTIEGVLRRKIVLDAIERSGLTVARIERDTPVASRNSLISMARLCVNIAQNMSRYRHVPPRVPFLANNRACCPSDSPPDEDGYLSFAVPFADDEALVDGCRSLVAGGRYRAAAEECYERFRTTSSVEAFEKTIAALDT